MMTLRQVLESTAKYSRQGCSPWVYLQIPLSYTVMIRATAVCDLSMGAYIVALVLNFKYVWLGQFLACFKLLWHSYDFFFQIIGQSEKLSTFEMVTCGQNLTL